MLVPKDRIIITNYGCNASPIILSADGVIKSDQRDVQVTAVRARFTGFANPFREEQVEYSLSSLGKYLSSHSHLALRRVETG